jgi:hypothetical protein
MLARTAFRRSWGGLIAIVLVLAIGLGAAVTAIEAADRTVSAYPDYLERNEVADLVVNTVLANERTQEIIEGTSSASARTAGTRSRTDRWSTRAGWSGRAWRCS